GKGRGVAAWRGRRRLLSREEKRLLGRKPRSSKRMTADAAARPANGGGRWAEKRTSRLGKSCFMNGLTRWNPFREMQELHHRLNTLLDAGFGRRTDGGESLRSSEWEPAVDIVEDKKEYIIQADLPGLRKQDVNVTFENGILRLSGQRKHEAERKDWRYHRVECP